MTAEEQGLINEDEIRKAITQLFRPRDVFECRILQKGRKKALSGYFQNADDLIKAFSLVDLRGANVYVTLQVLDAGEDNALMSKEQGNRFVAGADSTADKDVKAYQWFFIDLDPVRRAGISSSKSELDAAYKRAADVAAFMNSLGFSAPVKAISGNGAHLLYRIGLTNTKEREELIKDCLRTLDYMFTDEIIAVDTSVFNPSRICKLYGTLAQKGQSTTARPHRMSRLLGDVIVKSEPNDITLLERLADMAPPEDEPAYTETRGGYRDFDIEVWMNEHGIRYKRGVWNGGDKFVLDACPFNSDHHAPDSSIFRAKSGAIGFRCLHNSCQGKHWPDVRLMFEPDAYQSKESYENDKHIEEGWRKYNAARVQIAGVEEQEEIAEYYTMQDILAQPDEAEEYIRTGITDIDRRMKGLQKGCLSVLSGLRGSAKSTVLGQIALTAIQDGQTVITYSGELSAKNYLKWIMLQAAGRNHTIKSNKYEDYYETDPSVKQPMVEWFGRRLWLYNNDGGSDFVAMAKGLEKKIENAKADLVLVDNMMALDLGKVSEDKYEAQTGFVWELKRIAKRHNVHVLFVAHPRKAVGFLRLNDISGSGNVSNIVDNAFIIHRANKDFNKSYKEYFKPHTDKDEPFDDATNIIEVCKDRENGTQDLFIPLYFERQTKRLRNDPSEYVHFGWEGDELDEVRAVVADEDNPF